jgi:hypothetical protein
MALFRRILSLGKRARLEQEIDAELREHMAMSIDDNMAQGMSREEAERDARRRFGNPTVMRERVSTEDAALGLGSFWDDVRGAMRVFTKSSGFSLVVVATLALGIGANAAIFELLDTVLLQSLPVKNPQELAQVRVVNMDKARGSFLSGYPAVTNLIWERLREDHQGFSGIAAWRDIDFSRDSGGDARFVNGLYVSGEFFRVLGVRPAAGRVFTAEDDRSGCGLPGACDALRILRRARCGTCYDRSLWRDVLHGNRTDERDRHSDGSWRATQRHHSDDSRQGRNAAGSGVGAGCRLVPGCGQRGQRASFRIEAARSGHARLRRPTPGSGHSGGQSASVDARSQCKSD